ncbi:hypothetical protein K438DRAFT_1771862 [Mycena galopus ATCC 62051]|nr:hypothetical protein K438DRAFT_1771862 [Mycena galopus ATCC 62051]
MSIGIFWMPRDLWRMFRITAPRDLQNIVDALKNDPTKLETTPWERFTLPRGDFPDDWVHIPNGSTIPPELVAQFPRRRTMSRAPELCLAPRDRVGEGTYYLPKAGDHNLWRIAAPRDLKDIVKALNDPTMLKRIQVVRLLVGVQSASPSFIYLNSAGSSLCGTTVYIGRFAEAGKTSLLASFLRSNYDLELARPLLVDPEHVLRLVEFEGIYYLFDIDDLWHGTAPRNLKDIVTTLNNLTKLEKLVCAPRLYIYRNQGLPEQWEETIDWHPLRARTGAARRNIDGVRVVLSDRRPWSRMYGVSRDLRASKPFIISELLNDPTKLEKTNLDLIWENFLGQFILPPDLAPHLKERYGVELMQVLLLNPEHTEILIPCDGMYYLYDDTDLWRITAPVGHPIAIILIQPRAHALIHSPGEIWARTVAAAPCPHTGRRGCIRWTTVITYGTWRLKSLKAILEALNDSTELEVPKLEAVDAEYDDSTDYNTDDHEGEVDVKDTNTTRRSLTLEIPQRTPQIRGWRRPRDTTSREILVVVWRITTSRDLQTVHGLELSVVLLTSRERGESLSECQGILHAVDDNRDRAY